MSADLTILSLLAQIEKQANETRKLLIALGHVVPARVPVNEQIAERAGSVGILLSLFCSQRWAGFHNAAAGKGALSAEATSAGMAEAAVSCSCGNCESCILKQRIGRNRAKAQIAKGMAIKTSLVDAEFLLNAGRSDEAEAIYRRALAAGHEHDRIGAVAWNGLGCVLRTAQRLEDAADVFRRALAIDDRFAATWANLGSTLDDLRLFDEAREAYTRAGALSADTGLASNALFAMIADPTLTPEMIAKTHVAHGRRLVELHAPFRRPVARDPSPERPLRIGYLSPDFCSHPVSFFIAPILAAHDKEFVEVVCYHNGRTFDAVSAALQAHADKWRNIAGLTDDAVCGMVEEDQIDILVDLAGHTSGHRSAVFARKPAPVQVSYLGYPCTTGLPTMDYRITDAVADPPGAERLHAETLVRPFSSFLCYQPPAGTPDVAPPPFLKNGYVTFGSFNHARKLTPDVIRVWCRILREVPGSRLVLKSKPLVETECMKRMIAEFESHGVDARRVDLLPWKSGLKNHFEDYAQIDIALDPWPYNGTTTTLEALWMGVPVVTLEGRAHAGRVSASILRNIKSPNFPVSGEDEYVGVCAWLAKDPVGGNNLRCSILRERTREALRSSPLMDAAGFTRALEGAYRDMWKTWCAKHPNGVE